MSSLTNRAVVGLPFRLIRAFTSSATARLSLSSACAAGFLVGVAVTCVRGVSLFPGRVGLAVVAALVFVLCLAGAVTLVVHSVRSMAVFRTWRSKAVLGVVLLTDAALMAALDTRLPIRFGLLSLLVYCVAPAALARIVTRPSRRTALEAMAALAILAACTYPLRAFQIRVAAQDWFDSSSSPPRDEAQSITVPGLVQEPYSWDGTTLTAWFDFDQSGISFVQDVETVTAGYANPCGPIPESSGDSIGMQTPPCAQAGPGLWARGTAGETDGFVLQRDGFTVILTGPGDARADLRAEILAAHPASDAELWKVESPSPATVLGVLLL